MDKEAKITPEIPNSAPLKERGRFHDPIKYVKLTLAGALGLAIGIACNPAQGGNTNITESPIIPTATATATVEPSPTVTSTPEPTAIPKPEVKPFDCGILSSSEACKSGEHVRWILASGREVDGIAFNLSKGIKFKIAHDSQVAATQSGEGLGYSITAVNRADGERLTIFGDVIPDKGLDKVGKNLDADSTIGESNDSGAVAFSQSNVRIVLTISNKAEFRSFFQPLLTDQPRVVYRPDEVVSTPTPISTPGDGKTFFDVPPPPGK